MERRFRKEDITMEMKRYVLYKRSRHEAEDKPGTKTYWGNKRVTREFNIEFHVNFTESEVNSIFNMATYDVIRDDIRRERAGLPPISGWKMGNSKEAEIENDQVEDSSVNNGSHAVGPSSGQGYLQPSVSTAYSLGNDNNATKEAFRSSKSATEYHNIKGMERLDLDLRQDREEMKSTLSTPSTGYESHQNFVSGMHDPWHQFQTSRSGFIMNLPETRKLSVQSGKGKELSVSNASVNKFNPEIGQGVYSTGFVNSYIQNSPKLLPQYAISSSSKSQQDQVSKDRLRSSSNLLPRYTAKNNMPANTSTSFESREIVLCPKEKSGPNFHLERTESSRSTLTQSLDLRGRHTDSHIVMGDLRRDMANAREIALQAASSSYATQGSDTNLTLETYENLPNDRNIPTTQLLSRSNEIEQQREFDAIVNEDISEPHTKIFALDVMNDKYDRELASFFNSPTNSATSASNHGSIKASNSRGSSVQFSGNGDVDQDSDHESHHPHEPQSATNDQQGNYHLPGDELAFLADWENGGFDQKIGFDLTVGGRYVATGIPVSSSATYHITTGVNGWKFAILDGHSVPSYVNGGYPETERARLEFEWPDGIRPGPPPQPVPWHRCEQNLVRDRGGNNTGRCGVCQAMTRFCKGSRGYLYCEPDSENKQVCGGCEIVWEI